MKTLIDSSLIDEKKRSITNPILRDQLNRPLHDVRISVIDRCNFRCRYCMPEESFSKHYQFLSSREWLTFDQIERLVRVLVKLGVKKVRLTGGEPLLRPRLQELIFKLKRIPDLEDLALTTNGSLLKEYAIQLKQAGLNRLTVSLDTLDEKIFAQMTGNKIKLQQVLDGLTAAQDAGFESIKINTVIQKGINDQGILDLIRYFKGTQHIIRFIEYMDAGECHHWELSSVVKSSQILSIINQVFPLKPIDPNYPGEVAKRYQFVDGSGEIGFISSVSQPFCGDCSRARISADGKLYTCLFTSQGTALKPFLQSTLTDFSLSEAIQSVWRQRNDRYSEQRLTQRPLKKPAQKKVEMFHLGG